MKKLLVAITLSLPFGTLLGGDFSDKFTLKWKTGSALQVKEYVDSELKKRPDDPSVLVARSLVAALLEEWGRGAAKFLEKAIPSIQKDPTLENEKKNAIIRRITLFKSSLTSLANSTGEPKNSIAKWNPKTHEIIFRELKSPPFETLIMNLD